MAAQISSGRSLQAEDSQLGANLLSLDPPTATFAEEPGGGHKVASAVHGEIVRPFAWQAPSA